MNCPHDPSRRPSCWAAGTMRDTWKPNWESADNGLVSIYASHLKSDVIELAAVADGRSARMDHTVHRNDARAAPRGSPGPPPHRAPRRGAAGCGFAFNSLLARHFTRFPNELFRTLPKICAKLEGKVAFPPPQMS